MSEKGTTPDPRPRVCIVCRQPIPPGVRQHEVTGGVICDPCHWEKVNRRIAAWREQQREAESKL